MPKADGGHAGNFDAAATDQRGVARPQGAYPDVGAVEWDDELFHDVFDP